MIEEAFVMVPDHWSPIHVAEDGEISFFYLQEKGPVDSPILERLAAEKAVLSADAERYLAEKLIRTIQKKQAIVIPMQKDI